MSSYRDRLQYKVDSGIAWNRSVTDTKTQHKQHSGHIVNNWVPVISLLLPLSVNLRGGDGSQLKEVAYTSFYVEQRKSTCCQYQTQEMISCQWHIQTPKLQKSTYTMLNNSQ